jgi:hypothetical protein
MSESLTYLEQSKLDNQIQMLQRECSESRWALSTRSDYEGEITRLEELKADLAKRMAEDEA